MRTILRIAICWVAFVAALLGSGIIGGLLHLPAIIMPGGTSAQLMFLMQLVAGLVLVVGLVPMARGLAASAPLRAAVLGGFLVLALGVNGMIEAKKFTHFLDNGIASASVYYFLLAALVGATLGWSFGAPPPPAGLPHRSWIAWAPRLAAIWLAWPVIYFFFGMCVSPIVVPYYHAGIAGLRLPSLDTILEVQLFRSVIFLAASLPFIALWKGSRRGLWLTLGLAHAFTVGLYGLVGATFLPMVLRVSHTVEMVGDSFAYAGLLVLLFAAPAEVKTSAASLPHDPHPLPV
ncbi:MAG: hypothetical protein WCF30_19585 [Terracidiphilus sp.]